MKKIKSVLFVSSEVYPLIKTGGLADVSMSLPSALLEAGLDVRVMLPAYRTVLDKLRDSTIVGWLFIPGFGDVRILEGSLESSPIKFWMVDAPALFDRGGNPYTHPDGYDWPDNGLRFAVFSQAAALMASDALKLGWSADVVHANDWQTGLVPAFLSYHAHPPKTVFTIHNMAYDCHLDYGEFQRLHLPPHWWSMEVGEFYGRFSFMKAGLVFSDHITTVSPTYAKEICTQEYGYGYADILQHHQDKLIGILNGIDADAWNPQADNCLAMNLSDDFEAYKQANRQALLKELGNKKGIDNDAPLIGFVGRMVHQKGIDLLLDALPKLFDKTNAHVVIVGSGEASLEELMRALKKKFPERIDCHIGYSECLAHLVEAGADMFVMPSRYEPCGLNQMYSLKYGTLPIVRCTGGLADTIIDVSDTQNKPNGFVFEEANSKALFETMMRAIKEWKSKKSRQRLIKNGMKKDLGWDKSAKQYISLYTQSKTRE